MIRHRWDISVTEAIVLQKRLAEKVRFEPLSKRIETIAGTDCAFLDGGKRIVAVGVLCDAKSMEVLEVTREVQTCRFPYVPGLLSFREGPAVIAVLRKLSHRPDLLICDGQGVAHPRGVGLASHVGLWVDLPTIGAAKSRLCGTHRAPGVRRGSRTQLRLDGKVIGTVLRTRTGVKPLYVSVGHRITLTDAVRWTLRCSRSVRLPEPTRRAHQYVTRFRKEHSSA